MKAVEDTVQGMAHHHHHHPHNPYYPPGLSVPNYAPNITPVPMLFLYFGLAIGVFLTAAVVLARRVRPQFRDASFSDQALFVWFTLCGGLHCFFESYFVINHATIAGSQAVLAQLWKQYALSDSRYLVSDPFILCVEGLTALVYGPMCFAAAVTIVRDAGSPAGSSGLRHVLQILVSAAHFYGVMSYYGTLALQVLLQGISHCRPEFVYFWVYFVGMNAPWVFVPAYALNKSIRRVCYVFDLLNRVNGLHEEMGGLLDTAAELEKRVDVALSELDGGRGAAAELKKSQ